MKTKLVTQFKNLKMALDKAWRTKRPQRHPEFFYQSEQHQFELDRETSRLNMDWRRVS